MKIQISVQNAINYNSAKKLEEIYDKCFKALGYKYNSDMEEIYMEYKNHNNYPLFNSGDLVILPYVGLLVITWRCYNLKDNVIEYVAEEQ